MLEQKDSQEEKDGEVVYRRIGTGAAGEEPGPGGQGKRRRLSLTAHLTPTLKAVIIGFALLLALVLLLGYLSVRKTNEVGRKILEDERHHVAVRQFALDLRLATTKLDNEARARGRRLGDTPEETRPLFDAPLNKAREDVRKLILRLASPPYSESEKWRSLTSHLVAFLQATQDPDTYLREGYVKFRDADKELDDLLSETQAEQNQIFYASEQLEQSAANRIYLMTGIALLMGALVATYTIREMQRRFRQVRESMDEARREREFSAQMLEGMVSAVAAVDSRGRIRSANGAFFHIFPEARVGASVHEKLSSSPDAMRLLEAATSGVVQEATYRGRWVCGDDAPNCVGRSFDVYSSPLKIDNEQGQIITLVDVTEAAEAESNLRRTEALTAMGQAVAQVAHEIKNPLGSIRLGVSMLRDSSTDEESQSTIDLVERGINHLNKLVIDVTQFSRQRPLELSRMELHTLIDSSLELAADAVREKRTPIEKHYSNESIEGQWDADQLRQVFVNLIANAIDASPEGSPVIISTERVRAERKGIKGGNGDRARGVAVWLARVTVEDRGAGMDEKTRARIFEPFFTTKKRGTGLGLAIVKQIVEQHDGTISVESAPGKGTRFTVDLPIQS
ncbi:MAG: ATP-binding protein [Acidobacteriota bacterium]|nr:ATP-binding protein [Acidobacteriota bacterium]